MTWITLLNATEKEFIIFAILGFHFAKLNLVLYKIIANHTIGVGLFVHSRNHCWYCLLKSFDALFFFLTLFGSF